MKIWNDNIVISLSEFLCSDFRTCKTIFLNLKSVRIKENNSEKNNKEKESSLKLNANVNYK